MVRGWIGGGHEELGLGGAEEEEGAMSKPPSKSKLRAPWSSMAAAAANWLTELN